MMKTAIPFALFVVGVAVAFGAPTSTQPISLPANAAFASWLLQEQNFGRSAFSDPQTLAQGLALAQTRAQEMRGLMEQDPAEFVRRSMPAADIELLPPQLQPLIEKRVKGRGFFGVYCAGLPTENARVPRGGYAYEARLAGTNYRAFVFDKWRDEKTVYDAAIEGTALDDAIALGDSPTPSEQAASGQTVRAYTPTTSGPNTLLYMITQFADQTSDPIDEGTASIQMSVVSNFWLNASYGIVFIKGLVHSTQACDFVHIRLPKGATNYVNNFSQLLSDARAAAAAQGFNYANYNLDVAVTSNSGFSYAGYSWIGAQGSHWVTPYTTLRTAGHELGHNLGLYHADYWRTDSTQPFGKDSNPGGYVADYSNGEWVEYGHYFSVMSAQYGSEWDDATKPIYNPVEKVRLGWLSGSQVQYITSSGTYRLFRHDARTTVGIPRGIRIETPATDYTGYARHYWLSYRYAPWSVAQNWYQNGLEVDVAQTSYGSDGSILLDMSPYSADQSSPFFDANNKPGGWWTIDNSDKLDGALVVGRTYDDVNAGIHITPIATGNNGPGEEFIDVIIKFGSFAGNRSPIIGAFTATTNQVSPGQPVNFNVAASDPDGDSLAYSWDFDETQVWTASGLNNSSATKSWSTPGQYQVVARVSDMKGGVATASQIITVGVPSYAGQIWGRVVWAGQPVSGARVATSSGSQAWSGSDGAYVLTDLIPGSSYVVDCQAQGLTFTPQFSNPVSLVATDVFGIDFYANELVGGGGTTFTVSGQVTDAGIGVAGVEVRGGGMVTTTDSAGNYQLSNFFNGSYTVAARNGAWSFSPASRSVTISSANSTGNSFSRVAPYSISGNFTNIAAGAQSPAPIVYLSNGRSVLATKAGSGGNRYWTYTLNSVPAGQYSVTAELSGYSIMPANFVNPVTVGGNLTGLNFTGSAASVAGYIAGQITEQGLPLARVNVQASRAGTTIGSVTSDSDGYYRIENLTAGSCTVTPAKAGYSFAPGSLNVAAVPSSANNFAGTGQSAPPIISALTANPVTVSNLANGTTLAVAASGVGTLSYSWDAISAAGPVSFSQNDSSNAASTTVGFQSAGNYTFRARVADTNGFAAVSNVSVTVSAGPGTIAVSPYQVQVAGGQVVQFRADAWDQLGNRISVTPAWAISGGGTIDTSGSFIANSMGGPYSVTAVAGALSATAFVWVTSANSNATVPVAAISVSNAVALVTWSSVSGAVYRVQYKDSLTNSVWNALTPDVTATGSLTSKSDPIGSAQRFYRVLLVQ